MTLTQNQFYCVSCRKKVTLKAEDICFKKFKNDTPALIGNCKCDCNLTKFVKKTDAEKLKKKFGTC